LSDDLSHNTYAFNGYYFQEKYLSSLLGVSLGIQQKLMENLYIGASCDFATYKFANEIFNNDKNSLLWKDYSQGTGITLSYLSLIGPVKFNISKAQESHDFLFQFSFGYKFD